MANASKKHMGAGTQGKGTGAGALTDIPKEKIGDNDVLSNRDKKQHSNDRGQDSKYIQTEQLQDTAANHLSDPEGSS